MKKCIFFLMFLMSLQVMQAQTPSVEDDVKRFLARAKTAYGMGEYQDALEEYQKAQRLIPNYPDLYKAIGDVYEKLGGDEDLRTAIENFNQYLYLSPQATDKEEILERIASLEYKLEKQVKQTQIMDDLSGLWISNLDSKDNKNVPYVILKIEEIQRTGRYRVTVLPESGFYRESLIEKTVSIIPEKDGFFRFTFADAQTYAPSGAKYDLMRVASSLIGNDIARSVTQIGVNALQSGDLPSNTRTAYDFELKYNNGELDGLLNIIRNFSSPEKQQTNQDLLREISFIKNNEYFDYKISPQQIKMSTGFWTYGMLSVKNNMGHERTVNYMEDWNKMLNTPQFENIKLASKVQKTGGMICAIGIGGALGTQIVRLFPTMDAAIDSSISEEDKRKSKDSWNTVANYAAIIGGASAIVGIPIMINGNKKMKAAIDEYNNTMRQNKDQSYNLNFGITPSGNLGLTLNF